MEFDTIEINLVMSKFGHIFAFVIEFQANLNIVPRWKIWNNFKHHDSVTHEDTK